MSISCDEAFLAEALMSARAPLVLTGAGLSVASGIRPYRGGATSTWSTVSESWATQAKFHDDPRLWWETFWVPWGRELAAATPNAGHHALRRMTELHPTLRVITQNIDGLDRAAGLADDRLIEVHGTASRLICADVTCGPSPPFSADDAAGLPPRCPRCRGPARPLVLMFDEDYYAHSAYRAFQARTWLAEADCLLLVGTSASTSLAAFCIDSALGRKVPILSVNPQQAQAPIVNAEPGYAEVLLPRVARLMEEADGDGTSTGFAGGAQ